MGLGEGSDKVREVEVPLLTRLLCLARLESSECLDAAADAVDPNQMGTGEPRRNTWRGKNKQSITTLDLDKRQKIRRAIRWRRRRRKILGESTSREDGRWRIESVSRGIKSGVSRDESKTCNRNCQLSESERTATYEFPLRKNELSISKFLAQVL